MKQNLLKHVSNSSSFPRRRESSLGKDLDSRLRGNDGIRRFRSDLRGFTLLELLIAITLLGLIMATLFGGLRLAARSWDAGEARVDRVTQVRAVTRFLKNELNSIYPMRWKKSTTPALAFIGEKDSIQFIGQLPSHFGVGGLRLISFSMEAQDSSQTLIMKSAARHADDVDFAGLETAEKTELMKDVEEMEFSYFGAETLEAEPKWLPRWQDPQRLPNLIKVTLKPKNSAEWPALVVAPIISPEAACVWHPVYKRCIN